MKQVSKAAGFYFDELVWRTDAGLVDQARTELASIRDDVEFERQIFLIRLSRNAAGFGNGRLLQRESRFVAKVVQPLFVFVFGCVLLSVDVALRIRKSALVLHDVIFANRMRFND